MSETTQSPTQTERELLLAVHLARQIPGDCLVLSDELLEQVLRGESRLTRAQFDSMVASPLTLCRLRFLESQRLAEKAALAADEAAWQSSEGELLVASPTDSDCTLQSTDGLWTLHALTTGSTTRLLLQLRRPEYEDGQLSLRLDPEMEVAVLDGSGGTLLLGKLDDDGELEAVWDRPEDLRSHLARAGGAWTVDRV